MLCFGTSEFLCSLNTSSVPSSVTGEALILWDFLESQGKLKSGYHTCYISSVQFPIAHLKYNIAFIWNGFYFWKKKLDKIVWKNGWQKRHCQEREKKVHSFLSSLLCPSLHQLSSPVSDSSMVETKGWKKQEIQDLGKRQAWWSNWDWYERDRKIVKDGKKETRFLVMLSSLDQWYFWNNLKCHRSSVSKRKPSELMIPAHQNTVFNVPLQASAYKHNHQKTCVFLDVKPPFYTLRLCLHCGF